MRFSPQIRDLQVWKQIVAIRLLTHIAPSICHLLRRDDCDNRPLPYDVTFVNKYQSRCILGSNGGNPSPYCC